MIGLYGNVQPYPHFQISAAPTLCLRISMGWKCTPGPDWIRMSRAACGTQGLGDPSRGTAGQGQGDGGQGQGVGGQGLREGGPNRGEEGPDLVGGGLDLVEGGVTS